MEKKIQKMVLLKNLNNMNILKILSVCLFFMAAVASCKNQTVDMKYTALKSKEYVDSIKRLQVFKTWVRDTMPSLLYWKSKSETYTVGKDVGIEADSISVYIETIYSTPYIKKRDLSKNQYLADWVESLSEYDTLPNEKFKIFVGIVDIYVPSYLSTRYDVVPDDPIIQITTPYKTTFYTTIRGRVNNKKEIFDINGKLDTLYTDFIWENGKMRKKSYRLHFHKKASR
jgi:hypothetical protein